MKEREQIPFADALAIWHMADLRGASGGRVPLTPHGNVAVGIELEGAGLDASVERGGDGRVARFDGMSWLAADSGTVGFDAWREEFSLCVRTCVEEPGGLLHTNLFSLLVHGDGLVVGWLGVEEGESRMVRELVFSRIDKGHWHDLIVRYARGSVELFCDGVLLNSIPIAGRVCPVLPGPVVVGGWRIEDPPLTGFPQSIVDGVFQRLFTGALDHAALWGRAVTDGEIAFLSGTDRVGLSRRDAEWQQCLSRYQSFYVASRARDVVAGERLGLDMRRFMARDPRRPIYHLTAPMGWISDPAGAIYHDGKYHLFSYRNVLVCLAFTPLDHYISDDMIHWRDMPVAAWADSEYDVYGIWLANTFLDGDGTPSMTYTAHGLRGKIGVLARSSDGLVSFGGKTPVITDLIHHDGYTWKGEDKWYGLTTSQFWGQRPGAAGDGILLLSSDDLEHWTTVNEVFRMTKYSEPDDDLQRWGFTEFPYLVPFGEKHVLMTGTRPVKYWVGRYDEAGAAFRPDEPEGKLLDYLNPVHCFNPLTTDDKGPGGSRRRIVYAMHPGAGGEAESVPWWGLHVLPRTLELEGTRLLQAPVAEVGTLRGRHVGRGSLAIAPGEEGLIDEVRGDALEIIARFAPGDATRFGMKVRVSDDRRTSTVVYYDVASGDFGVEGNVLGSAYRELGRGPAYLEERQSIEMRVFLDKCLLEAFLNGHTCSGVFTSAPQHVGLDLFSEGGAANLISLDVWEMEPAWPLPKGAPGAGEESRMR